LSITGARIREYLLEKSRITTQNQGERNYHVFYELLAGLSAEQKDKYGLLTADKYFYLNQGANNNNATSTADTTSIPGKSDKDDFQALLSAMQILGMGSTEIDTVFKLLAAGKNIHYSYVAMATV
jgi:myosin-15